MLSGSTQGLGTPMHIPSMSTGLPKASTLLLSRCLPTQPTTEQQDKAEEVST